MRQYRLTAAAENDQFEIWAFIASDNLPAADRLEADILREPANWSQKDLIWGTSAVT